MSDERETMHDQPQSLVSHRDEINRLETENRELRADLAAANQKIAEMEDRERAMLAIPMESTDAHERLRADWYEAAGANRMRDKFRAILRPAITEQKPMRPTIGSLFPQAKEMIKQTKEDHEETLRRLEQDHTRYK